MAAAQVKSIYQHTILPRDVTKFTLTRGIPDYSNLAQFDLYEKGYSFLICLQVPIFMDKLAGVNEDYKTLLDSYRHVLEYDFRGAEGIENMSSDPSTITNGITELNMITRTTLQNSSNFTMNYFERSGGLITKTNELYLRGIKDPRSAVKRYNGLLKYRFGRNDSANVMNDKGFQYEVYHFLLIVTDNTALNLEKAYLLAAAQPNMAQHDIYNVTRGQIEFAEIQLPVTAYPLQGRIVNEKAITFLDWINDMTCMDEMSYQYQILTDESLTPDNYGTIPAASNFV